MGLSKDPLWTPLPLFPPQEAKTAEACLAGHKARRRGSCHQRCCPRGRRNVLTPAPLSSGGPPLLPSVGSPPESGEAARRRREGGRSERAGEPPAQAPYSESHSSKWWSLFYARAEALNPATRAAASKKSVPAGGICVSGSSKSWNMCGNLAEGPLGLQCKVLAWKTAEKGSTLQSLKAWLRNLVFVQEAQGKLLKEK